MKKYLFLALLCLTLLPWGVFAQEDGDVADLCPDQTAECECSTTGEAAQTSTTTVSSVAACESFCFGEAGLNDATYTVTCDDADTSIFVDQGTIQAQPTLTGDEAEELITPALNVQIPGLTLSPATREGNVIVSNYIGEYIEALYRWLINAAAIVSVVIIMIGGMRWILAGGDATKVSKAKTMIGNAFTGLVLLLSAYTVAYIIDPELTVFDPLVVQSVEKFVFVANETPENFSEDFEITQRIGNNGTGWNGVKMYDQKAYADVPYGPDECLTETSGNIKSSGCGVTAFAMVASTLSGSTITPPDVAPVFVDEGYRPMGDDGCGHSGTHSDAYVFSSLISDNNLRSRRIGIDKTAEIFTLLEQDKLVIVSYRTASGGGHYVVLTGVDENGQLLVNNPWGGTMERRSKAWLTSTIRSAVYIDKASDFIP